MFQKTLLASALALTGFSAQAAEYYVVVPMPGAQPETGLSINVVLNSTTLPNAVVGVAYTPYDLKTLLSVTGDAAYNGSGVTWSTVSSSLPAGLSLRTDGTIGGTPTATGTGSLTARATYLGVNGEQTYQIVTLNLSVALASATLPDAVVGQSYASYDLKSLLTVTGDATYTGADVIWSVVSSSLPAGLSLRTDGTIGGTPTASGSGQVIARATYKGINGDQTYQIVALNIGVSLASAAPQEALVGQAFSYDLKSLLSATGDAGYNGSGVTWSLASGSLPTGLTLNADGTITGTPTSAGTGEITARATYRGVNGEQTYQVVTLSLNVSLDTATLPNAVVGVAYTPYDLKPLLSVTGDAAYNGSNVTWSVVSSSLPAGLSLRTDGTIGGTPTASGSGTLVARATYKGVNGEQTYQIITLNIAVSLATAAPPEALVGQSYSYDLKNLLSVTGDAGYDGSGVTWSVVSSTLPAGLTLRTDGTIGGTPTASGSGQVVARATYRGVNGEQTYQVVSLGITVSLSAATLTQGQVGQAYSYDVKPLLTVTGDPAYNVSNVTWSVASGTLPAGLTLNADGTITGTPTAGGTSNLTLQAAYRGVNGQQTYSLVTLNITVSLATATLPNAVVGVAYTPYDLKSLLSVTGDAAYNGSNVTWSVVSSSLPAGLSLRTDGTIGGTPTASGTGTLVARATYQGVNGDQTYQIVTLNIAVSLATAAPPDAVVGVAYSYDLKSLLSVTGDAGYTGSGVTWSVVSSTLPAGLTLRTDGTIGGTPTAAGSGQVIARATYKGVNGQQTYQVVSLGITVSLSAATLTQGQVGQAYSYDVKPLLTVTGDPAYNVSNVTWSVASGTLPAGITLNADGTLTGTPTAGGTSNLTLQAAYRGVNGQQTYSVTITLNITVSLATAALPGAVVGVPYTGYDLKTLLTVSGDPAYTGTGVTWSVVSSSLPAGLSLLSDGTIAGTPTAAGTGTLVARATYKGINGEQTYQIVSLSISVTLSAATLTEAVVGAAYSYDLKPLVNVTGDGSYTSSAVTWSQVSGTLPAGLTLNANGTITGTPTTAASNSVTFKATYRGVNGQQTYSIVTLNISVSLATATLPNAVVGVAYTPYDLKPLLTVSGDAAYTGSGVTWSVVSSTLPAGLSLLSDGTIAGTPTASGTGNLTARATYRGANGQQTYQIVSLAITVTLNSATITQGVVGVAYSYDLKPLVAVTGDASYISSNVTWSLVSGTIPAGLTLNADGTITGTPTAAANNSVTIKATYRGINGQRTYSLVTLNITVSLATATLTAGKVNTAYTAYDFKPLVTVTGDAAYNVSNVTFSATGLPSGMSLSTLGVLSGTPTVKSTAGTSFNVVATYKTKTGQRAYTLIVNGQYLDVTKVAAGGTHTCALTPSGGVKCWGLNNAGQLGNNTLTASSVPVDVSGLTSGVTDITAGSNHSCAILSTGAAQCWGNNSNGALGNNSTTNSKIPVAVSGLTSGVTSIAGGFAHTCAVVSGAAKCWGQNVYGQLGNSSTTTSLIPVSVTGLTSGTSMVTAGTGTASHTCAVVSGAAKCWGYNLYGQLGNNTTTNSSSPVAVSGLTTGVSTIEAGDGHTCAVTTSGGAKCWGYNNYGQLGNNTTTNSSVPVDVSGLTSGVSSITGGGSHSCVATTGGGAQCWGWNAGGGQLGNNSTVNSSVPVSVSGLTTGVSRISGGYTFTCAVLTSGGGQCWGANGSGQLGDSTTTPRLAPVNVVTP